jgi:FkbM family methyltransferase
MRVPGVGQVHLRPATSDLATFREIFVNGEYDFERHGLYPTLKGAYDQMLSEGRVPVILDAGANVGLASLYLSRYFPKAKFVLVEANTASATIARLNAPEQGDWEIHEVALWDRSGNVSLKSSLDETTREVAEAEEDAPNDIIEARTAAEILGPRAADLLIVKMDIEGAEIKVLSFLPGDADWLANKPMVMIEPHDGVFNSEGSIAGLLSRPCYHEGIIIPNGSTILFLPRYFNSN